LKALRTVLAGSPYLNHELAMRVALRGRAGYAFDRFIVYGTGGAAFGNVGPNFSNDPVTSLIEVGWTAGAGVEVALPQNASAKAELRQARGRIMSTDRAIANGPPVMPTAAIKFSESMVRGGINYSLAWQWTGRSRGHASRRRGFLRSWKISGIISHPGGLVTLDPRYGFG
jgi:Outer membrane protein beta-barrel domain